MPAPPAILGFSPTIPAAISGRYNVTPQSDGAFPIDHFSYCFPNHGQVEARTTTTESVGQADQGRLIKFTNSAATAVTLATPVDPTFMCYVIVTGAGTCTFTPASGTINGAANVALTTTQDGVVFWDGTNWELLLMAGGGSSGVQFTTFNTALFQSTSAYAMKGLLVVPFQNLTVESIFANIYGNSGDVYQALIYSITGTSTIATIVATSATHTFGATQTGMIAFDISGGAALTAGTTYGIVLQITSGTSTTVCAIDFPGTTGSIQWFCPGMGTIGGGTPTVIRSANVNPTTGTTLGTATAAIPMINLVVTL